MAESIARVGVASQLKPFVVFASIDCLSRKMASALQRPPPKAKVQPPYPLADAPVISTGDADTSEAEDIQRLLHPRAEEGGANNISRRTR